MVQIFEVIGFIYQYIKLLRQVSPQEWIFRELQDIGSMDFQFAEEQPQDEYAAELAGQLFGFNVLFSFSFIDVLGLPLSLLSLL